MVKASSTIRRLLTESSKKGIVDPSLTPAAVLVLLYLKDGECCVLLNKRSDRVEQHKGEVSFPGGVKDDSDATLLETALRECQEEMGVAAEDVELLGELDDTPTSTSFLISPFVGTIPYPYDFSPSEVEVAEVLEVPVPTLLDPDSSRDEVRIVDGLLVNAPVYSYGGHLIHGATARILERLLEVLGSVLTEESLWTRA